MKCNNDSHSTNSSSKSGNSNNLIYNVHIVEETSNLEASAMDLNFTTGCCSAPVQLKLAQFKIFCGGGLPLEMSTAGYGSGIVMVSECWLM